MNMRQWGFVAALLCMMGTPKIVEAQLHGAGGSFPEPIYAKWFEKYKQGTSTQVSYQVIGSGPGVQALKNKTVDFGASDVPLTDAEEEQMPGKVVQFPTVGGAVVMTYNLPGLGAGLRFTPDVIADIFLGKIKTWSDARIKAINPGKTIPDLPIHPIHRQDGSGTTNIFTSYLTKVSPSWAAGPGTGKSVTWPGGGEGKGNGGVSTLVNATPGGIGYVELAYAIEKSLPYGSVKNSAGNFITPSDESVTEAIGDFLEQLNKDVRTPIVNGSGEDSYPISGLTFVLIYKDGAGQAGLAAKLWIWAMQDAQQKDAKALHYSPLPAGLLKHNLELLKAVPGA